MDQATLKTTQSPFVNRIQAHREGYPLYFPLSFAILWRPVPWSPPSSEPNLKPKDATIWVFLPGQSRVESGFEGVTGRYSAHPATINTAPHSMIPVGVFGWPSLGPVPVLKLLGDREGERQAVLASGVGGGILPAGITEEGSSHRGRIPVLGLEPPTKSFQ